MTTHVFIVDTNTFKYHLEYMFAWTWAKDYVIDFNSSETTNLKPVTENMLISMIADSQRIRKWDFVIFYLQQNFSQKIYEWKFYWIFKVKSDFSFLDNNTCEQFLHQELGKSLTFRTLLEPYKVYAKWVTEWEALDEIKNIQSPYQMLWSLIYRKLKWNRWNTMITIYEAERIFKLIRDKNRNTPLDATYFTFDSVSQEVKVKTNEVIYSWQETNINVLPRLINKYNNRKAFEAHLQAYITQNIWRWTNTSLDQALLWECCWELLEWIGNEVSCWVWMQRIDIMLSLKLGEAERLIMPIELKAVEANMINLTQIQRYIDWLNQYYVPNRTSDIKPILIAKKSQNWISIDFITKINEFNTENNCMLKYVEYEVRENNLLFEQIEY